MQLRVAENNRKYLYKEVSTVRFNPRNYEFRILAIGAIRI